MSSPWAKIWPIMADTHCHPHDYDQPEELIAEHTKLGVTIHQMTIHPEQYLKVLGQEIYRQTTIHTCLGLYPLEVDLKQERLSYFLELLQQTKWVGEIGLDYSIEDKEQIKAQHTAFESILKYSHKQGGKVLSIHSRRAGREALELTSLPFSGTIIHHWYSGPTPDFKSIPDHLYFSINTAMLRSRNGRRLLEHLPLSKTLLESDGPYIQQNDQPVKSKQLISVIEALAKRHQLNIESTAQHLYENYLRAINI